MLHTAEASAGAFSTQMARLHHHVWGVEAGAFQPSGLIMTPPYQGVFAVARSEATWECRVCSQS